jgi:hypothetical protein
MTTQTRTVEEVLREVADSAAMLRYALDSGALNDAEPPDQAALSGLADAARQLHERATAARRALSADALSTPVRLRR